MRKITIVAALCSTNRAIGRRGQLLWRLPRDLQRFRELTQGGVVIMGRKTWESLPVTKRPLPDRTNIVISRNPEYEAVGGIVVPSLDVAIGSTTVPQIFVIGGAEIYKLALPLADQLELTFIDDAPTDADAFFPEYDVDEWRMTHTDHVVRNGSTPSYTFVSLERVRRPAWKT